MVLCAERIICGFFVGGITVLATWNLGVSAPLCPLRAPGWLQSFQLCSQGVPALRFGNLSLDFQIQGSWFSGQALRNWERGMEQAKERKFQDANLNCTGPRSSGSEAPPPQPPTTTTTGFTDGGNYRWTQHLLAQKLLRAEELRPTSILVANAGDSLGINTGLRR